MSPSSALYEPPAIRCFLSYAHDDETSLGFVHEFKSSLHHFAYADSGRRVEIFLDRESIGWGEDWRESIRASIRGAMVFIPLITHRYFDSVKCREELLFFYETARRLGVIELLLPVVVLGERLISEDSKDQAVRIVAQRQYRLLRDAVLDGTSSATWRKTLLELANDLVAAVERAEGHLAEFVDVEEPTVFPTGNNHPLASGEGSRELMIGKIEGKIIPSLEAIERLSADFNKALESTGTLTAQFLLQIHGARPSPSSTSLSKFLDQVRQLAAVVEDLGARLESATLETDSGVREACIYLSRTDSAQPLRKTFEAAVSGTLRRISELEITENSVSEFLEDLRPIGTGSVPLRTALRPLRNGVKKAQGAAAIVRPWRHLLDT